MNKINVRIEGLPEFTIAHYHDMNQMINSVMISTAFTGVLWKQVVTKIEDHLFYSLNDIGGKNFFAVWTKDEKVRPKLIRMYNINNEEVDSKYTYVFNILKEEFERVDWEGAERVILEKLIEKEQFTNSIVNDIMNI